MECIYDERLDDYVYTAGAIPWSVRKVVPREDYSLILSFADGTKRVFDCKPLLDRPPYRHLADLKKFLKASAEHGTVDWGNDVDISPEHLYENSTLIE
ncbi:DUF2442 domain-containing protein [Adlercreutzia sp. R25]|uniref:DUF2442 domain-containing protein n=1 Tax=Adlercreutzia shanghongiae TaxID=3111773 RepID=A0ABU6IZS0_9ACTN|nr:MULTISPECIES: DUF2442 domain-containing protein [unclassified Adlercreutzia]MEC4273038.1 DUF2442 domain-containing protein [Adlercreutzia sp. R25]MEC4295171.1 DUF2442 domain-containing protein [Adlercreutzia sp. R22]